MPLKLIDPRLGKTPYFAVRGTYLGERVDQSTRTSDRRLAKKFLAKIEDEIECGAYAKPGELTFALAVISYVEAGGEKRFLKPIIKHFGNRHARQITQDALDSAARELYPFASPATRNRQVYSPTIAVLTHCGIEKKFSRPKGAQGVQRTSFLSEQQAWKLFKAAGEIDYEFRAFLIFLCYTGCRLSEALNLKSADLNLAERWAYIRTTKNGQPRMVHLPPVVIANVAGLPQEGQERAFRFRKNGYLYSLLALVAKKAKVTIPERVAFHIFRHTYGAWMKRRGADLVATGAWKSKAAAAVYEHLDITEEARKADLLPIPKDTIG